MTDPGEIPAPRADAVHGSVPAAQVAGEDAALCEAVFASCAAALAVVVGPELRFAKANPAYRALTPAPEQDPTGLLFEEVWPGGDPVVLPALHRALDTGEPVVAQDYTLPGGGAGRTFALQVRPIGNGNAAVLIGLWDTTVLSVARRAAEEAAERAVRHASELDAVLEALPEGLVIYGPRGEIRKMNSAAAVLVRTTAEEREAPFTVRWGELYRATTPAGRPVTSEDTPTARALAGEQVHNVSLRVERGPHFAWLRFSGSPIRAPGGEVSGAVVTFSDETAIHALEEARDDLVRMISHDLRTPLNAVLAQAQLLRQDAPDATVEGRAHAIVRSCRRMATMIEDLLEATLLEAGQIRIRRRHVDLAVAIPDIVERHRGALPVERVRIQVSASPPRPVQADPERLERIVVNLVSNALKYSPPESEVTIAIAPAPGGVLLEVSDRGVGISPEDMRHVFDRFYRARVSRLPEGLGLGLYITRLLVYAHGGRIDAESRLGHGTTFRIFLPVEPPPLPAGPARP